MRILVSPSIHSRITAECEALKRGFVLGVDAAMEQMIGAQEPQQPAPATDRQQGEPSKENDHADE
jgi:hypothetical protein